MQAGQSFGPTVISFSTVYLHIEILSLIAVGATAAVEAIHGFLDTYPMYAVYFTHKPYSNHDSFF